VLLCSGCSRVATQKRTPLRCCVLGLPTRVLCERKPRRAVLLWLAWRPTEAHAAVLLRLAKAFFLSTERGGVFASATLQQHQTNQRFTPSTV
jgi:hypothetical protein